jgi:hypothetical protein
MNPRDRALLDDPPYRPLDRRRLDALWPVAEPPPDFADRVLAACARPSHPSFPRWLMACCAFAAAILLPLLLLQARPDPLPATARATTGADLGAFHD